MKFFEERTKKLILDLINVADQHKKNGDLHTIIAIYVLSILLGRALHVWML